MSQNEATAGVFLLAENRLLREALARILSKKDDIRVVGAASFSLNAIDQVASTEADVVLLDSAAVVLSDPHFIRVVRRFVPGIRVLMVGMEPDESTFLQLVREGVVGYVLKEASATEVAAAVRAVASGEAVCPPRLALSLFQFVARQKCAVPNLTLRIRLGLTRREQQLVELISQGLTNKEIATQLSLSEQTVKNHVHRMLRKMGANDRLGVVEMCRAEGLSA
jgi:two-component system, NarL family, nitrate/nitrite response regulator NarL